MKRRRVAAAVARVLALGALLCTPPASATPPQQRGGTAPANDFRYERLVKPGAPGANRLAVDVPLLAGGRPFQVASRLALPGEMRPRPGGPQPQSGAGGTASTGQVNVAEGGLTDLRFYDEDGSEVQYLLVQPAPRTPSWQAGRVLPVAATKKASGFEVELAAPRSIDRLALIGLPAPYLKRARLEGSGDRAHWTLLAEEATLFDLPDEQLTRREVEFTPGEYRYLRVTWDDGSSARLPPPRSALVRLVDRDAPPATLRAAVPFERRASEPGSSRYRLALPAAHLPIVAVELSIGAGNVLRPARVMESRLSGSAMDPVRLGSGVLRRAVRADVAAASLSIPVSQPQESQLELVVEDGSNAPLEIAAVSVVFADLPWIYFEAPSDRPMMARFGSQRAAAPRYDLEALRPSVHRVRAANATWGDRLDINPAAAATAAAALPVVGGFLDRAAFAHARPIPPGPRGLAALRLGAAALARSRFSDLRIAMPDGRQLAYVVERLDEPLTLDLAPLERVTLDAVPRISESARVLPARHSIYRLSLPEPGLPASRLVIETPARLFSRGVSILSEPPGERGEARRPLQPVANSSWNHGDPDTKGAPLTLSLPPGLPATLWLVVAEGDNSPLPLEAPRLLLPAYRLRFFRETDAALTLLYGNPSAEAPRYDLALLAPRLVGAAAVEAWPGDEAAARPGAATVLTASRVFWAALIAAVVVLLVLLARLLKA